VNMRPLEVLSVSPSIAVLYKQSRFSLPSEEERRHALSLIFAGRGNTEFLVLIRVSRESALGQAGRRVVFKDDEEEEGDELDRGSGHKRSCPPEFPNGRPSCSWCARELLRKHGTCGCGAKARGRDLRLTLA
jgi:hypothetical protein